MDRVCPKCGSVEFSLKTVGPHLGIYCTPNGHHVCWVPKPTTVESASKSYVYFGKYKDKRLSELPLDYLYWLGENIEGRIGQMAKVLYEHRVLSTQRELIHQTRPEGMP